MHKISNAEARALVLSSQGLAKENSFGSGILGAQEALKHLGYIQIDTISVVERAHHHVFWSRVTDYKPEMLGKLVAEKSAFEYWSHAAAFLPMEDFRFSLPRKHLYLSGQKKWTTSDTSFKKMKAEVLKRIAAEGPLSARDFETSTKRKSTGWWDWKPAKIALEQLFFEGELMVKERRGFQKIYDVTERVLPANVNTKMPTDSELARHLILKGISAHGLIRAEEIAYQRNPLKEFVRDECQKLLEEGSIEQVLVKGNAKSYFAKKDSLDRLGQKSDARIQILSPFDNQVIQRKRMKELFNFDYQIECYVPEAKRKFGYFSLPLLQGTEFIGRIDAKAHRESRRFEVKSLHLEKTTASKKQAWKTMQEDLKKFASFNACDEINLSAEVSL